MATNPSSIPLPPGFELDAPEPSGSPQPILARQAGPPTPQTPENRENTVVGTQEKRTQIANTAFDNVNNLRKQFESEQSVQDYKTVLPLMDNAFKLGHNKAGDLNLVYAFGKAMDPNSVVREGEQVMATNVGGVSEKVQGYLDSIKGQGQLTPIQRTELTEEIRHRAASLQQTYNQRRAFYQDFAQRNGIKPEDVVGPHPGEPFIGDEKSYIAAHGGAPRDPYAQPGNADPSPPKGRFGDDFGAPGTEVQFKDDAETRNRAARFQDTLYGALSSKKLKSQGDIDAFVQQFNHDNGSAFKINWNDPDTRKAIGAAMQGKKFGVERPTDPAVEKEIQRRLNNRSGGSDAALIGAATDIPFINHMAAGADAVRGSFAGEGSLSDNYNLSLDATKGYEDVLRARHKLPFIVGQLGGGLLLPAGEARTPFALAKVGAAYGAAYGFDQGDPNASLTQRGTDTLVGAGAGAALGYAIPKGINLAGRGARGIRDLYGSSPKEIPPLIDPTTGTLNEPLEAAGPAARVAAAKDFNVDLPMGAAGDRTAAIIERKLDVRPASAGIMNDARRVTEGQVQGAAENVAASFGQSRTLNEGGSEVQRSGNEWMARANKLDTKVYDAIPIKQTVGAALSNTRAKLAELTSKFQSNPKLAAAFQNGKLGQFMEALSQKTEVQQTGLLDASGRPLTKEVSHSGELSWQDLKDFRSRIGYEIGEQRLSGDSPTKDELRTLYGALSEDMRATAQAQGPKALRAFERANTYHQQMETRIEDGLTRILGPDAKQNPERAAKAIQSMTMGGKATGDLKALAEIKASTTKGGGWDEIAGTLIRLGGKPADSPGRSFDPGTFVRWYSDMAEQARTMLFKPELRKALDQFVMVNQRLANSNALRNTSNTALASPTGTWSMPAAFAALFTGHPFVAGGIAVGTGVKAGTEYGMAKLWTSPTIVRWFTGYSRALASGNASAAKARVGALSKMAATNPQLREPIQALLSKIANDNAPQIGTAVASPDQRPDQQQ